MDAHSREEELCRKRPRSARECARTVFDTVTNWQDDHRFLKTAFDTSVQSRFARNEVQFGYIERATYRNTSWEKAKFEVSNHKYTDLSEPGYGVAVLKNGTPHSRYFSDELGVPIILIDTEQMFALQRDAWYNINVNIVYYLRKKNYFRR